jgi:hypothetical protein
LRFLFLFHRTKGDIVASAAAAARAAGLHGPPSNALQNTLTFMLQLPLHCNILCVHRTKVTSWHQQQQRVQPGPMAPQPMPAALPAPLLSSWWGVLKGSLANALHNTLLTFISQLPMHCIAFPFSFSQDKGDIVASAAAARAAGPHGPPANASGAACPSAFQLVGGAEGQPGQGSKAAARAAATAEQQRRQQLAAAPRAVDVLGMLGREEARGSTAATAAGERSDMWHLRCACCIVCSSSM